MNKKIKSQIVVIGSGPGGAVTAQMLAENGKQVLLIEEGEAFEKRKIPFYSKEELEKKYRNSGLTVAMGRPNINIAQGRCFGGASEINAGLYHRTPQEVLHKWQTEYQLVDVSNNQMDTHFSHCEKLLSVSNHPEGASAISKKLALGANKLRWESVKVPKWYKFNTNSKTVTVEKQTMSKVCLKMAKEYGCEFLTSTKVLSLKKESKGWQIKCINNKKDDINIFAEDVFVAAGAVQTPALLRRSGIKKNIGNTLSLHPMIKVIAKFDHTINGSQEDIGEHQIKEFAPDITMGCGVSTKTFLALGLNTNNTDLLTLIDDWQSMASYYISIVCNSSHGNVRSIKNNALVRYQLSKEEINRLNDGMKKLCQLLFESGAKSVIPVVRNGPMLSNKEEIEQLKDIPKHDLSLTSVHLFSSCPMGENKQICATNSFGKVNEVDNLYIADASLLCTSPWVNPQGTIMAFSRRNVLHYLNQ